MRLLCALFANLLAFYDLDYSLNVLRHETGAGEDASEALRKLGIDTADMSRPYIFQLLERAEQPERDDRSALADKQERAQPQKQPDRVQQLQEVEPQKKSARVETRVEPRVEPKAEQQRADADFRIQRPPEKLPVSAREQPPALKTESEARLTEEHADDDDDNLLMGESQGIDVTVDSEALQQFDYDESMEELE